MSINLPIDRSPKLVDKNWRIIDRIDTRVGYDLSDGLVAHYKMNDYRADTDVRDSVGGNVGTAQQNTEDISVDGKINRALSFNGSSDYIDCGDDTMGDLYNGASAISFSCWVKPTSISAVAYANTIFAFKVHSA